MVATRFFDANGECRKTPKERFACWSNQVCFQTSEISVAVTFNRIRARNFDGSLLRIVQRFLVTRSMRPNVSSIQRKTPISRYVLVSPLRVPRNVCLVSFFFFLFLLRREIAFYYSLVGETEGMDYPRSSIRRVGRK